MANLARLPLSSFDTRLRSLIERGCREYTEVPCENARKAKHFRNVLTMFRSRWKNEHRDQKEMWEPLYATIISTKASNASVVTLRPRLTEFDSILNGLNLPEPTTFVPLAFDPLADFEPEKPKEDTEK